MYREMSIVPESVERRLTALSSQLQTNVTAAQDKSVAAGPRVAITSRSNGVAIITIQNPPVNSLHPEVQQLIGSCYEEAVKDPSIKAVVITGGQGAFFMAGADIENVHKQQLKGKQTPADIEKGIRAGMKIFNALESGPKPTVAAVNGTALGGGCELAMACNARIAVPTATFGQPELNLGIIPGLGGCNRYPRLIGLKTAIQSTVSGKSFKAAEAQKLGLVDAVVKPNELIAAASKLALEIASGAQPRRKALYSNEKIGSYEQGKAVIETARAAASKKNNKVPHFEAYFRVVEQGLKNGGEAGLEAEIQEISKLIPNATSRALIHFFFASRATTKLPGIPAKPQGKPVKRVAIIGAGTMGAGIAIVFLSNGYEVILKEINEKALAAGVERVVEQVARVVKSRKLPTMAIEFILRGLKPTTTYEGFDSVDLVIEAALENLNLKQNIFAELEKIVPAHCILATNTSTIDIEKIAAKTKAQDRIIGLHYFSPAHIMPLLEIVRTPHTSPNVLAHALQVAKKTKKIPVVVGNCVGFTANRVFFPYGQAAAFLVDAGLSPYKVDKVIENYGMPMGVFKMSDLSGTDIGAHVSGIIGSAYGDRIYPSQLNKQIVDLGRLGQKSGAGYYKYVKGQAVPDEQGIQAAVAASRAAAGKLPNAQGFSDQDIIDVVFFPVVNECLRVVAENHVNSMSDVDVVSSLGYGYPTWRGGVLFWAEHEAGGWKHIRDRLNHFSNSFGASKPELKSFFAPSDLLNKLADGRK
jgi:enoyl-CoA hydratase/3-hydroxyacyl-CoA dehydrogenase